MQLEKRGTMEGGHTYIPSIFIFQATKKQKKRNKNKKQNPIPSISIFIKTTSSHKQEKRLFATQYLAG